MLSSLSLSLVPGSPELGTELQLWPEQRGSISPLSLLEMLLSCSLSAFIAFAQRTLCWLMYLSRTTGCLNTGSTALFAKAQAETINYFQIAGNQHFSHEDILWLIFHIIGNKPCREETGAPGVLNHLLCQTYPFISCLFPVHKDGIRIQSYICKCHYKPDLNNHTWLCEIISPMVAFKVFSFAGDIFNPHYCN